MSAEAFPGQLVTLDFRAKTVAFQRGSLPPADGRRIFQYEGDRPTVPIRIAGLEVQLRVDTGNPEGLTLPLRLSEQIPLAGRLIAAGKGQILTTDGGSAKVAIFKAPVAGALDLGEYTFDSPTIRFSDEPAPWPGNVGDQILRAFKLTIDSRNRRLLFERRGARLKRGSGHSDHPHSVGFQRCPNLLLSAEIRPAPVLNPLLGNDDLSSGESLSLAALPSNNPRSCPELSRRGRSSRRFLVLVDSFRACQGRTELRCTWQSCHHNRSRFFSLQHPAGTATLADRRIRHWLAWNVEAILRLTFKAGQMAVAIQQHGVNRNLENIPKAIALRIR